MPIVSIDDAVAACKSDGDDNELLQKYIDSAQSLCEEYCQRKFYADENELAQAQVGIDDKYKAAYDEYFEAMDDADETEDGTTSTSTYTHELRKRASKKLNQKLGDLRKIEAGIVADKSVWASILSTTVFLYFNRDTASGLPQNARDMLDSKVNIGGDRL